MRRLLLAIVALALCSGQTKASDDEFRELKVLNIFIFAVDDEHCGISEERIKRAVLYQANAAGIGIAHDAATSMFVRVDSLRERDTCVSHIGVEVDTWGMARLQYLSKEVSATIRLWDNMGAMIMGSKAAHARGVEKLVEDETKKFFAVWKGANK
jgi:hypothetical protein